MTDCIMAPYSHPGGRRMLLRHEQRFNKEVASHRVAVEHAFGGVKKYWGYAVSGKRLRLGKMAVVAFYKVAVLLNNVRCYMRGN